MGGFCCLLWFYFIALALQTCKYFLKLIIRFCEMNKQLLEVYTSLCNSYYAAASSLLHYLSSLSYELYQKFTIITFADVQPMIGNTTIICYSSSFSLLVLWDAVGVSDQYRQKLFHEESLDFTAFLW